MNEVGWSKLGERRVDKGMGWGKKERQTVTQTGVQCMTAFTDIILYIILTNWGQCEKISPNDHMWTVTLSSFHNNNHTFVPAPAWEQTLSSDQLIFHIQWAQHASCCLWRALNRLIKQNWVCSTCWLSTGADLRASGAACHGSRAVMTE